MNWILNLQELKINIHARSMVAFFQSILMTFLVSSFPGSLEKTISFLSVNSCKEMYSRLGYPKHIGEKHDSSSSSSSQVGSHLPAKDKDQGDCNLVESEIRLPILPGLWSSCGELATVLCFSPNILLSEALASLCSIVVLPLFRKWLPGYAAEKRPRKDSFPRTALVCHPQFVSPCKAQQPPSARLWSYLSPYIKPPQNISQVKSPSMFCLLFFS